MGPQSYRDGIFSASDPLSPYGMLLTSYSDGTLGSGPMGSLSGKLARPNKEQNGGSTQEAEYYPEPPNYKLWALVGVGALGVAAAGYFLLKK